MTSAFALLSLPGLTRQSILVRRGESPMEVSTTDNSYRKWRDGVDQRLLQIYCITIEDAGFDEKYLINHWRSMEAPTDFVEWYGNKYDLDPRPSLVRRRQQGG